MKKLILFPLVGLVFIFLIIMIFIIINIITNPLRKSEEQIKENILKIIPNGTDMDDVIKSIENNKKWKITWINNEHGYGMAYGRPGEYYIDTVGVKSIRSNVGHYSNLFITDVVVYWGFDEDLKLIDIAVRKDTDSL